MDYSEYEAILAYTNDRFICMKSNSFEPDCLSFIIFDRLLIHLQNILFLDGSNIGLNE